MWYCHVKLKILHTKDNLLLHSQEIIRVSKSVVTKTKLMLLSDQGVGTNEELLLNSYRLPFRA